MSVKSNAVADTIRKAAPEYLADSWDNVGMQVGSREQDVNKVLLTLDVTEEARKLLSAVYRTGQMFGLKHAFDPAGLLNPGKVIPTLNRCAEYGKMLVRGGQIRHPALPRF